MGRLGSRPGPFWETQGGELKKDGEGMAKGRRQIWAHGSFFCPKFDKLTYGFQHGALPPDGGAAGSKTPAATSPAAPQIWTVRGDAGEKNGAMAVSSLCGEQFWASLGASWVKPKMDKMFSDRFQNLSLKGSRRASGGVPGWSWRGPRAKMGRSSLLEPSWAPSGSALGPFRLRLGPLSSALELP